MEKLSEVNYSYQDFDKEVYENKVFLSCQFIQTRFKNVKFINCLFIACNFSMASFGQSEWDRCLFKGCDFIHAFLDQSVFRECTASLSNFHSSRMDECHFGFINTENCDFGIITLDERAYIPASSRELVGEIIAKSSDRPRIQAFGALIKHTKHFCWETLISMGKMFLTEEEKEIVLNNLRKRQNFCNLIDKFIDNKGLLYEPVS